MIREFKIEVHKKKNPKTFNPPITYCEIYENGSLFETFEQFPSDKQYYQTAIWGIWELIKLLIDKGYRGKVVCLVNYNVGLYSFSTNVSKLTRDLDIFATGNCYCPVDMFSPYKCENINCKDFPEDMICVWYKWYSKDKTKKDQEPKLFKKSEYRIYKTVEEMSVEELKYWIGEVRDPNGIKRRYYSVNAFLVAKENGIELSLVNKK